MSSATSLTYKDKFHIMFLYMESFQKEILKTFKNIKFYSPGGSRYEPVHVWSEREIAKGKFWRFANVTCPKCKTVFNYMDCKDLVCLYCKEKIEL